ncbi:hypothetical protein B6264_03340 [Kitasatospora aureofaciens]|nr:hypothetical protein B6264_03340 [Kitasatospora aureofaciens]
MGEGPGDGAGVGIGRGGTLAGGEGMRPASWPDVPGSAFGGEGEGADGPAPGAGLGSACARGDMTRTTESIPIVATDIPIHGHHRQPGV